MNDTTKKPDLSALYLNSGGGATGSSRSSERRDEKNPANWKLWAYIPHCEIWQAVALSLDIEPPQYPHEVRGWPPEYERRLKIASAHIESKSLERSKAAFGSVDLAVFREWAHSLGWNLPEQFPRRKINEAHHQAAPSKETADDDQDEKLAALFDPLPVEALEKMFPADGKWKSWAEKAKANGLIDARTGRAEFNPYKAGVWFVRKGNYGWDDARLFRRLATNLPARSRDDAHLLTGNIE